ncbi:ABC transporter permease [Actinomadura rudentiformis]|uniref:ABC transporter permease n=1 Tax=Actinomadura rudentiformis TaxID=359158 RepID=A0A6H9YZ57_9ACTN|nr:ABC transporter permease [Actinomadura rudentiformis]KAB2349574.1 ABC transporter permease [Actinomadura rudentiformis]
MMMSRLALRSLIAHKARLALTAVAVVAGVAFVSGTLIFAATLGRSFDSAFDDLGRGTDTVVRAKKAFGDELGARDRERPLDASVLTAVRKADGVAKARGEVSGFAAVVDRNGKIVGPEPQVGMDWNADPDLSLMRLESGTAPRRPDEIVIDAATARAAHYTVGDRVPVALASGSKTFTVTGVLRYGDSEISNALTATAFEPRTAQRLLMERPGYTRITVHAADGVSQERVREAVAGTLPNGLEAITGRQAIDELAEPLREILTMLRTLLMVFAAIAVFVGSFIIFNTFSMLVAQRTREMALLRAVGAGRSQVTRVVLGEAAGVGLIGATVGLLAGGGLALGLAELMSLVAGEALPFGTPVVPASAVIAAYSVGLPVTLAAAYVPARRAAKIPPVAALREESGTPARSLRVRTLTGGAAIAVGTAGMAAGLVAGNGKIALSLAGGGAMAFFVGVTTLSPIISRPLVWAVGWPLARFGGAVGRMSRQNALRNPRQTAATASALMIGLALIGTVSVITQSMSTTVDEQLEAGLTADYRVVGRSQVTPVGPAALTAVATAPGVRTAVAIRSAQIKLDGKVQTATAGRPQELTGHFRLVVNEGTPAVKGTDLLVSRTTADANRWKVGTTVQGEFQDGAKAAFRVAGVYAAQKAISHPAPEMIIDYAAYRPHAPDATIDRIDLTLAPGADAAATRRGLESALAPWPNLEVKDRETIKADAAGDIDLFLQLILALLVLSVVIAALGIVNTLALSVVERTREIGLLRAVGLQRRQLRRMIRYEAVIISIFGALLGLAIGVVFGVTVQNAMAEDGVTELAVPVGRLLLYVPVAAVIGVLAAVWPARRAARLNVLDAVKAA